MNEFDENFWRAGRIAARIYRERHRSVWNKDENDGEEYRNGYDDEYSDDEMILQNEIYHRLEEKEKTEEDKRLEDAIIDELLMDAVMEDRRKLKGNKL